MKFKKSYFLLISLITILLCISSVSATSDVDNQVVSSNSGSDLTTRSEITDNNYVNHKLSKNNDKIKDNSLKDDPTAAPTKINTTTHSKDKKIKYGNNIELTVTVKDNRKKVITNLNKNNFKVFKGKEKMDFTYADSVIKLKNKQKPGTYSFLIQFLGNKKYNPSNTTVNANVFSNIKIDDSEAKTGYKTGAFKFKVIDENGKPITNESFSVGFKSETITFVNNFNVDNKGYITIPINSDIFSYFGNLTIGKHNITIKPNNPELILKRTDYKITVTKAKINIIADDAVGEVGTILKYPLKVKNAVTGEPVSANLTFNIKLTNKIEQRNITTNATGDYYFTMNLTPGKYKIAINSRDSCFYATPIHKVVTVKQKQGVLIAKDRTIKYNSDLTLVLTFKDKKTGKVVPNAIVNVKIYTGSAYVSYNLSTNSKGKLNFMDPLSLGKHKIIIKCIDPYYSAKTIKRYITVKKTSAKFSAPKIKTYYKSGKLFVIKLTNNKGKPIYAAKVNVKVYISKYKYYYANENTYVDGLLRFTVPYKPGTYKVVISSADDGYSAKTINSQIKITKVPTKLVPTKFKAKSGNSFKVKVIHRGNKKPLNGVKLNVKLYTSTKKYKNYQIKSDKKGYASLKIKQKPGKYKVVINPISKYYKTKNVKSTITVIK